MPFLRPIEGQRTYALLQQALWGGLALAAFGIYRGSDLDSLGILIAFVTTPVVSGQAYKSVQTARAKGPAAPPRQE